MKFLIKYLLVTIKLTFRISMSELTVEMIGGGQEEFESVEPNGPNAMCSQEKNQQQAEKLAHMLINMENR